MLHRATSVGAPKFEKFMSIVFISHSHRDKLIAKRIASDLEKAGHEVWIDDAEIRVGDDFFDKISEAINQVDYFLVLLSFESIKSKWVQLELEHALNRENKYSSFSVLPVMIDNTELPKSLSHKEYFNLTEHTDYHKCIHKIKTAIGVKKICGTFQYNEGFEIFSKMISQAKNEILVLSKFVFDWKNEKPIFDQDTMNSPERTKTFENEISKLNKISNQNFRYINLIQVPFAKEMDARNALVMALKFDSIYREFCKILVGLGNSPTKAIIELRISNIGFENTFVIIDRNWFYIEYEEVLDRITRVKPLYVSCQDNIKTIDEHIRLFDRIYDHSFLIKDPDCFML
jgi:hypothetical protein